MVWYQLTRWFAYLRIDHPQMGLFRWKVPGAIALIFTLIIIFLPKPVVFSGNAGFLLPLSQIIAALPGFFIAALAAVATFNKPGMDEPMPDPVPKVKMRFGAHDEPVELTRRVFLSYLFSYLTVLSLFIALGCLAANVVAPSFVPLLDAMPFGISYANSRWAVRLIFTFCLMIALWSLIITTLQGIYFLTERMHQR